MVRVNSAVGCDPGLASFGLAHVRRTTMGSTDLPLFDYELCSDHQPCSGVFISSAEEGTVAESNAARTRDLSYWLDVRLKCCVEAGAEAVAAERYEHLRGASEAAKLAAGHAALVGVFSRLDPLPRAQRSGDRLPYYPSAREVKRAVVGCSEASKRAVVRAAGRLVGGASEKLASMTAENRKHLADAIAVALWKLGAMVTPILIGEAPSPDGEMVPFSGPRFEHFWKLVGGDVAMGAFALRNLLSKPQEPDPRGKGGAFPAKEARAAAEALEPLLDGRSVIFAGSRVASAFGISSGSKKAPTIDELAWCEVRSGDVAYMAAVLPHPSEASRWWNEPRNVARAKTFLRATVKMS